MKSQREIKENIAVETFGSASPYDNLNKQLSKYFLVPLTEINFQEDLRYSGSSTDPTIESKTANRYVYAADLSLKFLEKEKLKIFNSIGKYLFIEEAIKFNNRSKGNKSLLKRIKDLETELTLLKKELEDES